MHRLTKFFRNLNIRAKLFGGYSAILILSLLILSSLIYSLMRTTVESGVERELKNSTIAILNTVRTTASVSIKNYLRSVAEKNLEIVESIYARQLAGEISESAAKFEAVDTLGNLPLHLARIRQQSVARRGAIGQHLARIRVRTRTVGEHCLTREP